MVDLGVTAFMDLVYMFFWGVRIQCDTMVLVDISSSIFKKGEPRVKTLPRKMSNTNSALLFGNNAF
jgi:hypothetical protein